MDDRFGVDRSRVGGGSSTTPEGSRPRLSLAGLSSRNVALAMAVLVAATAVEVLIGWAVGFSLLVSWLPGLVAAKVNAAFCLLALSTALALVVHRRTAREPLVWLLAAFVLVVSLATLWEHVSGAYLGIDQVLVKDTASAASPYPGRFAPFTAVAFIAAAVGLLAYGRSVRGLHPTELLAVVCAGVGGVSLLGYMYGATALRSFGSASQIALPAVVALIALGVGLVAADPEHGLVRQMSDPNPAGQVARRILPAALIVVPLGAWLRLVGERAGLYDESVGLSILVTIEALVLVAIGVWTTASVNRLVSQRRQAELDLVRLGAAVSTPLIETAPIGLAVLDRDLRFLYVNPAMAVMNGVGATTHLGQRLDRVAPELAVDLAGTLEGVVASGRGVRDVEVNGRGAAADHHGTWLLSAEPLRDDTGEPVGLALSVVEITERKRREEALAALSELQKQAQVISDTIPFGFWTADVDGRVRYLSQSFLDLIGRTDEEVQQLGWAAALAPEAAADVVDDWRAAVATRHPWSSELAVRGTDGRTHTVLARGFPIHNAEGKVTSWAGINLDITDRKEAEAFREAFADILSHELRTPVTSIHAASTLLARAGLEDGQRDELLNDIVQEADRLRRLVEDMVILARVERGTIQIHTEPVALPHVLRKVCAQEQARWPDRPIELKVVGEPAVAMAEATLVEQVLRNLLTNAAKYCSPGAPIDVIADTVEGQPRVRVLDRGPGVDPEEADRLFELFYRSARTAAVAGSGIGLFLAHRLIQSMNGRIWARPRDDGPGAEFGFILQPMTEES
jgi:PAS domain S-box-containing protein